MDYTRVRTINVESEDACVRCSEKTQTICGLNVKRWCIAIIASIVLGLVACTSLFVSMTLYIADATTCRLTYSDNASISEEEMQQWTSRDDWVLRVPSYDPWRRTCVCKGSEDINPKQLLPTTDVLVWIAPGDLVSLSDEGQIDRLHETFANKYRRRYSEMDHVKVCMPHKNVVDLWSRMDVEEGDGRHCHVTKGDGSNTIESFYLGWDGALYCAASRLSSPPPVDYDGYTNALQFRAYYNINGDFEIFNQWNRQSMNSQSMYSTQVIDYGSGSGILCWDGYQCQLADQSVATIYAIDCCKCHLGIYVCGGGAQYMTSYIRDSNVPSDPNNQQYLSNPTSYSSAYDFFCVFAENNLENMFTSQAAKNGISSALPLKYEDKLNLMVKDKHLSSSQFQTECGSAPQPYIHPLIACWGFYQGYSSSNRRGHTILCDDGSSSQANNKPSSITGNNVCGLSDIIVCPDYYYLCKGLNGERVCVYDTLESINGADLSTGQGLCTNHGGLLIDDSSCTGKSGMHQTP